MKTYQNQAEWTLSHTATEATKQKIDSIRKSIQEGTVSYDELYTLELMVDFIPLGDVELLEWVVPEFEEGEE